MPCGVVLNDVEKGQILAYVNVGKNLSEISRLIERSRCVIRNFINNKENYGKVKRSGRKRKLSERDERKIVRAASNSTMSCRSLAGLSSVKISKMTAWRTLQRSSHIVRAKMKRAPRLLARHKEARMKFAGNNMDANWTSVIFSDEKKWNLDGPDGSHSYWRDLRKEPQIFSKRNFDGGSAMTWGAFSSKGCLELQFTSSKMKSADYKLILQASLLPFLQQNNEEKWIFQQDNARIHTSKETMEWMRINKIEVMEWPACSPDLNPIENVWGILARRVYAENKTFENVEGLKQAILTEWENLEGSLLLNLITSMKKRIFELIKSKGCQINY